MKKECINVKNTKEIIFHSDLGAQYISKEFSELLKQKGIQHSYSKKDTPYDNAKIESFHSIIKKEEIYVNKYKNFEEAKIKIFESAQSCLIFLFIFYGVINVILSGLSQTL